MGGEDFIFDSGNILIDLHLGCDASSQNWWWVGGYWGKYHCPEHLMLLLLVMALPGPQLGLLATAGVGLWG